MVDFWALCKMSTIKECKQRFMIGKAIVNGSNLTLLNQLALQLQFLRKWICGKEFHWVFSFYCVVGFDCLLQPDAPHANQSFPGLISWVNKNAHTIKWNSSLTM